MTQSYPPNYPSHFYEWTSWAVVSLRRKRQGNISRMPHCDSPLSFYESLFTTDGSPFPWVFFMPQWFIKGIYNNIYVFSSWYPRLWKVKSRWDMNHRYCCWMLMALERHFPCGRSQGLTGFFFFSFPSLSLFLFLPHVIGEGRKGVPGIIWGGRRRRRGPVIHNACYLTQHTDLLLTRTGLYLQHQCHHMTTVHDKALFFCQKEG